ncbi:MAG: hypothetical protein AAFV77_12645, partial [Planctomycetota bacterium]
MPTASEAILKYKTAILRHVGHENYSPSTVEKLAEDLRAEPAELKAAVEALAAAGDVALSNADQVTLPSLSNAGDEITGTFQRSPRGFGFIRPDTKVREGQVYVHAEDTQGALTGDKVRAHIRRDRKREASGRGGFGPQFVASII